MPAHFVPEQAAGINTTIQVELSGEGGGVWHVRIADQQCTINEGPAPMPNATLGMPASDYVALINGTLNPVAAFMQGRVRVQGDLAALLQMQSLFRRDT
jgi:putative sterol carrier protein